MNSLKGAAARVGDTTEHGGTIVGCSANVFVNSKGAARLHDMHVCPSIEGGMIHVGGPISKASTKVFINGVGAARVGDELECTGIVLTKKSSNDGGCETKSEPQVGFEGKKLDKVKEAKGFLYGVNYKQTCAVGHVDGEAKGWLGSAKIDGYFMKREHSAQVGVGYDTVEKEGFAGAQAGGGGAVLAGELTLETAPLRIPGTDWGLSLGAEGTLSLGTVEAKGGLVVKATEDAVRLEAFERAGAVVGQGVKLFVALKRMSPPLPPPATLIDIVAKGSGDVFFA